MYYVIDTVNERIAKGPVLERKAKRYATEHGPEYIIVENVTDSVRESDDNSAGGCDE